MSCLGRGAATERHVSQASNQAPETPVTTNTTTSTQQLALKRPTVMGKRFSVTKEQNIDDVSPLSKFNANQTPAADDSQQSSAVDSVQRKTSGVGLKLYTNRIPSEAVMQKMEKDLTRLNLLSSSATTPTTATPLVSATIQSRMKSDSASGGVSSSRRRQETDSGYLSKDTNKSEFDPSTIDKEEKTKDLFSSGNEQVKSGGSSTTGGIGTTTSTSPGYSKSSTSRIPYTPTYYTKLSEGGSPVEVTSPSSTNPPYVSSLGAAATSNNQHQNQNLGQRVGESITSTSGAITTTVVNYNINLASTNSADSKHRQQGFTNQLQIPAANTR